MRSLNLLLLFLLITCTLTACSKSTSEKPRTLRVAVAASIAPAAEQLKAALQASTDQPGLTVEITVGSSGTLAQQIIAGSPIDIFMAADTTWPAKLHTQNLTTSPPITLGQNRLCLLLRTDSALAANLSLPSINPADRNPIAEPDLAQHILTALTNNPAFKRIALAKPELAPTGFAAREALTKLNLFSSIESKLVYADNADKAAGLFIAGTVEAAFLPRSLTRRAREKTPGSIMLGLPNEISKPTEMALVTIKRPDANPIAKQAWLNLINSPKGQKILQDFDLAGN